MFALVGCLCLVLEVFLCVLFVLLGFSRWFLGFVFYFFGLLILGILVCCFGMLFVFWFFGIFYFDIC